MLTQQILTHLADAVIAAPADPTTAPAEPAGTIVNTDGILKFVIRFIAPIAIAFLGVIFLGRARNGEVSKVLTSTGIVLVGVFFLAGAAALPLLGDDLVDLFIAK